MSSKYKKLKLWRGGEQCGYIAIHERDYEIIRTLFLEAGGYIVPVKTHILGATEYQSDGSEIERGEGEDLAGFDIEATSEDVHLAFGTLNT